MYLTPQMTTFYIALHCITFANVLANETQSTEVGYRDIEVYPSILPSQMGHSLHCGAPPPQRIRKSSVG